MSPESGLPGEVECFRFCCAMRSSSLCSEHPLISLKSEKKRVEERKDRRRVGRKEEEG